MAAVQGTRKLELTDYPVLAWVTTPAPFTSDGAAAESEGPLKIPPVVVARAAIPYPQAVRPVGGSTPPFSAHSRVPTSSPLDSALRLRSRRACVSRSGSVAPLLPKIGGLAPLLGGVLLRASQSFALRRRRRGAPCALARRRRGAAPPRDVAPRRAANVTEAPSFSRTRSSVASGEASSRNVPSPSPGPRAHARASTGGARRAASTTRASADRRRPCRAKQRAPPSGRSFQSLFAVVDVEARPGSRAGGRGAGMPAGLCRSATSDRWARTNQLCFRGPRPRRRRKIS